jgi:translation initiation factor IF-2
MANFSDIKTGDVVQCVRFVKKKASVEKIATGGARVVA